MSPTETPVPNSSESSPTEDLPLDPATQQILFLERPAADLIDKPLSEMSDAELNELIEDHDRRVCKPGEARRVLADESVEIVTKKPRAKRTPKLDLL